MISRGDALVTSSLGQIKKRSRKSEMTIGGLMFPVIIPAEFSAVYLKAHRVRKNPVNRPDKLLPVPCWSLKAEKESNVRKSAFLVSDSVLKSGYAVDHGDYFLEEVSTLMDRQ